MSVVSLLCPPPDDVAEFHHEFTQLQFFQRVRLKKQNLAPIQIQHSQTLEYAPLLWDLVFFPDKTCSCCAESKLNAQAWGWQRTIVARGSDRIVP